VCVLTTRSLEETPPREEVLRYTSYVSHVSYPYVG